MPPAASRTKPTLLIARRLPAAVEARAIADYDAVFAPEEATPPLAALAAAHGAAGLLVAPGIPLDAATIGALPTSIRIIATFSVGTDHIDTEAAAARGLLVTNTPDVLTDATADLTLLLILAASRRTSEGERLLRAGGWTGWTPTQLMGRGLAGRRLGIFGMGRIGRAVAARARAFGMAVHYYSRRRLAAAVEEGAVFHETAAGLFAASDVLSLHCPLTPETRGLIDARAIALLPDGAVLINTARGPIVDDRAVIAALRSGRLFAAGLDVHTAEPAIDPGYLDLPNAVLLPHLGSATIETRNAMGFKALDNLDAYFAGRPPPNRVV
jgi:lactate dehydrogenase-like 2-hydroxyacid dehydrogenase